MASIGMLKASPSKMRRITMLQRAFVKWLMMTKKMAPTEIDAQNVQAIRYAGKN